MRKNSFLSDSPECDVEDILCLNPTCVEVMSFVGSWNQEVYNCPEHGDVTLLQIEESFV